MTSVLRYGPALLALALLGGPAESAPAGGREPAAVAIDPTLSADGATARLTLVLSRPVAATAFVLERPDRIVLDLPATRCGFGAAERVRGGAVTGLRCGGAGPGRSRLVLDLGAPAVPGPVRVGPGPVPGTSLLTVEIARSDRDAFRQAAAVDPSDLVTTTASLPGGPAADERPLLAIDAGHGGADPGALGPDGTPEKDVTLAFATELHRQLLATGRYRLLVIRPDDTFVPLDDRVKRARDAGARLFVSIHADQIANPQVGGATIYTGAERATDAESAGLAERENAADAAGGAAGAAPPGDIAGILHDLTLRETRSASQKASGLFLKELGGVARLSAHPRREAGFRVLRNPDLPSLLVELGYMSNARDLGRLTSAEWRTRTAGAMVAALGRFFEAGPPPPRSASRTASAARAPM